MMSHKRGVDGILILNKPKGYTSHDCVAKIRKLSQTKKVGHTGTLDPEVTGVLPVCLGKATRVIEFLTLDEKEYVAEITLGKSTTTEDQSGDAVEDEPLIDPPKERELLNVLKQFIGPVEQVPPMYSAVKVNGKRLYEYAFEGQEVDRKPRTVLIHHLELLSYDPEGPYPKFLIRVLCSKGTYIRTLGVDLGRALGHPAHVSALTRTRSGRFTLEESVTLADIERWGRQDWQNNLHRMDAGLDRFPRMTLNDDFIKRIKFGQTIHIPFNVKENQIYRIYDRRDQFVALYESAKPHLIKPKKVFQV